VRAFRAGELDVRIYDNLATLARAAAIDAAAAINDAVASRGTANVMLATGNSQLAFLAELVTLDTVDWTRVTAFHMDEYAGIANDHPASFQRYMRERVASIVPLDTFHYVDGTAEPEREARRYAALLQVHPLDLCCAGIGENGHLAFNDPPADFETEAPYLVVTLDEACRRQQVGEGWFGSLDEVPPTAISMSCRQILRSREILVIVPDARKADAVRATVEDPVTPEVPASILRRHEHATLYVDPPAASKLSRPPAVER
jgi:glucosamine-6-phosphate deaminase